MKYVKVFVVAILLISLFVNVRLLSRLSNVEQQVNSISHYQMQIMDSVNNQTNNIYHQLESFKKEQSWISRIQMDVNTDNMEDNKVTLQFNWQIKELSKDSEVLFHYKLGEKQEYDAVGAVEIENGLFEANIPVDVTLAPEWHAVRLAGSEEREVSEKIERAFEEKKMKDHEKNELSYYVTVANEDKVKSSEINTNNISYLGTSYYGILETFLDILDEGYNFSVIGPSSYNDSLIFLEEAYLMKYKDGKLVAEEKLISGAATEEPNRPVRERATGFHKSSSKEKFEYTSLVVKVVYNNGEVFEKEVYSE